MHYDYFNEKSFINETLCIYYRKWRPFGSRRRRQQGRRGLKRNIPNTPAKQPGMRVRTKPGDSESYFYYISHIFSIIHFMFCLLDGRSNNCSL